MTWYSVKEAAPLIGLNVEAVYVLIESRRLGHRRLGVHKGRGKIQISDGHIAEFHRSCEVPANMENSASKPGQTRSKPARPAVRPDGKPLKYF